MWSTLWFLILKENNPLKVFDNGALKQILGPKKEAETGGT
jgi:hypothetical protein